jgi:hypothetical protein
MKWLYCAGSCAAPCSMVCILESSTGSADMFLKFELRQISRILDSLAWEIRMEFCDIADVDRDGLLAAFSFSQNIIVSCCSYRSLLFYRIYPKCPLALTAGI